VGSFWRHGENIQLAVCVGVLPSTPTNIFGTKKMFQKPFSYFNNIIEAVTKQLLEFMKVSESL
jgi:hypothetical protein